MSSGESHRGSDLRRAARTVWGASPAGTSHAGSESPGTRTYFERVFELRATREIPWLFQLVPFATYRGRDVLEVGCGAGYDAYAFLRDGAKYAGVDLTPENVDRTKSHLALFDLSGDIQVADAESLPYADGVFDLYFSNGVLHHVPSLRGSLAEAIRVLRPGGSLFITVYHRRSLFYVATLFGEHWILRGDRHRFPTFRDRVAAIEYTTADTRPLVNVYTKGEVKKALRAAGFTNVVVEVRKLTQEDLPAFPVLRSVWPRVPQRLLDQIGRYVGWYLVATASKPDL